MRGPERGIVHPRLSHPAALRRVAARVGPTVRLDRLCRNGGSPTGWSMFTPRHEAVGGSGGGVSVPDDEGVGGSGGGVGEPDDEGVGGSGGGVGEAEDEAVGGSGGGVGVPAIEWVHFLVTGWGDDGGRVPCRELPGDFQQPPSVNREAFNMRICLISIVLSAVFAATLNAAEPIDLGSRRELFVDRALIDHMDGGAELRLHRPTQREVALTFEEPWEGNASGYPTVIQDGDLYRMYYRGHRYIIDDPPLKQAQAEVVCYAESEDGIHWTKPNLGLFDWPGSSGEQHHLARRAGDAQLRSLHRYESRLPAGATIQGDRRHRHRRGAEDVSIGRRHSLEAPQRRAGRDEGSLRFAQHRLLGCRAQPLHDVCAVLQRGGVQGTAVDRHVPLRRFRALVGAGRTGVSRLASAADVYESDSPRTIGRRTCCSDSRPVMSPVR